MSSLENMVFCMSASVTDYDNQLYKIKRPPKWSKVKQ